MPLIVAIVGPHASRSATCCAAPKLLLTRPFVQKLLAAIRKAAPPGLWSQGVKFAREGAVIDEGASSGQVTLRVRSPGRVVPPTVVLYPEDAEWTCDCGGRVDPCEHVAAAIIALTAAQSGDAERAPKQAIEQGGRLRYRFRRRSGTVAFER